MPDCFFFSVWQQCWWFGEWLLWWQSILWFQFGEFHQHCGEDPTTRWLHNWLHHRSTAGSDPNTHASLPLSPGEPTEAAQWHCAGTGECVNNRNSLTIQFSSYSWDLCQLWAHVHTCLYLLLALSFENAHITLASKMFYCLSFSELLSSLHWGWTVYVMFCNRWLSATEALRTEETWLALLEAFLWLRTTQGMHVNNTLLHSTQYEQRFILLGMWH